MGNNTQKTLVLLKPDAVERRLVGEIVSRFERKGMSILAMRLIRFDEDLVRRHYGEHEGKFFYESLRQFITRGPVLAMVIGGNEAVAVVRAMMGATKFADAAPGTIRGDYAFSNTENLIHGSDSEASAAREIPLFFETSQIFE